MSHNENADTSPAAAPTAPATATKPKRPLVPTIVVPRTATPRRCNGPTCGKMIYMVKSAKTGKYSPVDCDVPGGSTPRAPIPGNHDGEDGLGVSHYATCPDADAFRRGR